MGLLLSFSSPHFPSISSVSSLISNSPFVGGFPHSHFVSSRPSGWSSETPTDPARPNPAPAHRRKGKTLGPPAYTLITTNSWACNNTGEKEFLNLDCTCTLLMKVKWMSENLDVHSRMSSSMNAGFITIFQSSSMDLEFILPYLCSHDYTAKC